jgi:hypothetical protein
MRWGKKTQRFNHHDLAPASGQWWMVMVASYLPVCAESLLGLSMTFMLPLMFVEFA